MFTHRQHPTPRPLPHLAALDLHLVVVGGCVFVGVLVFSPVSIQSSEESIWQGERRPPLASQVSRTNWNLHQKVPTMGSEKDRFRLMSDFFNSSRGLSRECQWNFFPNLLHQFLCECGGELQGGGFGGAGSPGPMNAFDSANRRRIDAQLPPHYHPHFRASKAAWEGKC